MGIFDSTSKQQTLMFCENRKLKKGKTPIVGNFLIDAKNVRAYLPFLKFHQKVDGLGDKLWLFLIEHRALPTSPYELYSDSELKDMTDADKLAEQALQYTFSNQPKSEVKNRLYDYTSIGILGLICTIIIIAMMVAFEQCSPADILKNMGW